DVTTIKAQVKVGADHEQFGASGTVMIYPGWRAVLPKLKDDEALPSIKDQEIGHAIETEVIARNTKPPPRYS
ncbi:DNA topoisomerase, partial [Stenotrophomonas maltophilia]|uniref:DNA topoisomerase n=1 Tax=Stenotrophomonas maltophilia TaxID=40324 RepID=UPI0013DD2724